MYNIHSHPKEIIITVIRDEWHNFSRVYLQCKIILIPCDRGKTYLVLQQNPPRSFLERKKPSRTFLPYIKSLHIQNDAVHGNKIKKAPYYMRGYDEDAYRPCLFLKSLTIPLKPSSNSNGLPRWENCAHHRGVLQASRHFSLRIKQWTWIIYTVITWI